MDWYIILLFGLGLLIFHMHLLAEHTSISQFLSYGRNFRMPQSVVYLLFSMTGGLTFLIPLYLTVNYGYAAETVSAMAGAGLLLALVTWRKIQPFLFRVTVSQEDLLEHFPPAGRHAAGLTLVLLSSEGLVLNIGFMALYLQELMDVHPVWSVFCMLGFCIIYSVMGGAKGFWQIGLWLFAASFIIQTLLPLSVYTFQGISPVIGLLSRTDLPSGTLDWRLYAGCAIFMFFLLGRLLTSHLVHRPLSQIKPERTTMIYSLGALIWSSIPLAVGAMFIYIIALAERLDNHAPMTWSHLGVSLQAHLNLPLTYGVTGWLLCSCLLGAGMSLHGMVGLLPRSLYSGSNVKKLYMAGVVFCLPLWAVTMFGASYLEAAGLLYLQFYLAGTIPLLYLLRSSQVRHPGWTLSIWVPALSGWLIALLTDWLYGSTVSVIFSYIITVLNTRKP